MEEFRELAPLLPSKQADAVFGRTEQPSGLWLRIFISKDVLGECALRAFQELRSPILLDEVIGL